LKLELKQKLVDNYPEIIDNVDHIIYCGDGWYWLIDHICDCIQSYLDNNPQEQIKALQIKSKFGELSFYINSKNEIVKGMIWFASFLSSHMCENCGTRKDVSRAKGNWVIYLCPSCQIIREKLKNE